MKTTQWSPTVTLRILVKEGKRFLQQRWTRIAHIDDGVKIEEEWRTVPTVEEGDKP